MDLLLGLFSLICLSLFLAYLFNRDAGLMPLVSVSFAMVWFSIWGCVGLLPLGGWFWYIGCLTALVFLLVKEKKEILRLFSPGLSLFITGGIVFILLFFITKPLFTQWDEFTFWGTAAKAVTESGQLYTTAPSNLIARSYPPGLVVLSYMMQFFSPAFYEYKMMVAYALLYLAAFCASSALWRKNRPGALLFFFGMFVLPFFFEVGGNLGQVSYSYLSVMSDAPMAALFGGSLALYFAWEKKDEKLYLSLAAILAALTFVKDMGLALALVALVVILADTFFCQWDRLQFFTLRKTKALLAAAGTGLAAIFAAYGGWALHLRLFRGQNRFDLGSQGETLSMFTMLLSGIKALFGIQPEEQFTAVMPMMLRALVYEPVSSIGPGILIFAIIGAVSLAAYVCNPKKRGRKRVIVFTITMAVFFAVFYLFNIFTYSFIFQPQEALVLKDYARYISPYWQGWLMGAMVLLASAASSEHILRLRVQLARVSSLAFTLLLITAVLFQSNLRANFLSLSPALFGERLDVKSVVATATQEGMLPEHTVYPIIQGDDATRFYMLGYEMKATRSLLFEGPALDKQGQPILNKEGKPLLRGNAAASFSLPGVKSGYDYAVPATKEDLVAFLQQEGCDHLLIDRADEYIVKEFAPLFSDKLEGWTFDDTLQTGNRYYRVEWQGDQCLLVPAKGDAPL